jgi:hypothetical protein
MRSSKSTGSSPWCATASCVLSNVHTDLPSRRGPSCRAGEPPFYAGVWQPLNLPPPNPPRTDRARAAPAAGRDTLAEGDKLVN